MRCKYVAIIFILIVLICTLGACGFVVYQEETNNIKNEQLGALKAAYILDLTNGDAIDIYYYEEYKEYLYQLSESINRINDCIDEESLEIEYNASKKLLQSIKTIEQYKMEAFEFKVAKDDYIYKLDNIVQDLTRYRFAQQSEIVQLVEEGTEKLLTSESIDTLEELYELYKDKIISIKTDVQLYEEELNQKIAERYTSWIIFADLGTLSSEGVFALEMAYSEMKALRTKEKVDQYFVEKSIDLLNSISINSQEALVELKKLYAIIIPQYASNLFLEVDLDVVNQCIDQATLSINDAGTQLEMKQIFDDFKNSVDSIKTKEDYWQEQDLAFIQYMQEKYGDSLLPMPVSLTEANNYEDLAQIIDYYAFYQLDSTTFERATFRVKLNWEVNNSARYEYNNVYWQSKLLRAAVDANCWYENGYFVIELIPYNFASITSGVEKKALTRKRSNVTYDSNASQTRSIDYDDFAINKYEKRVKVWNSQQLWYALQNDYYPDCVEGSIAELSLNAAKAILREIIKEDMDELEKIYQILSWFGENVSYDNWVYAYLSSSNPQYYPSEGYNVLRSFYVEGALIDKIAVCSGYAKAALVLMKLEGIETTHILAKHRTIADANSIYAGNGGVGSHEFLYIKIDGQWYYFDSEKSFAGSDESFVSKLYLLAAPSMQSYGRPDLVFENEAQDIYSEIYTKLKFQNYSVYITDVLEVSAFVEAFLEVEEGNCASIIVDSSIFPQARSIVDGYNVEKTFMGFNNDKYSYYEIIIGK